MNKQGKNKSFIYFKSCCLPVAIFVTIVFFINNYARALIKPGDKTLISKESPAKEVEGYVTTDDGVRLYYKKIGTGQDTLIIPNALYMFKSFKNLASDRTVIFYDLRNRGRSDNVTDPDKMRKGIHLDVDDLEKIRRYFGVKKIDVIGHSYLGLMVILYAVKYPGSVNRIVQIGAAPLKLGTRYPAHLTANEKTPVIDPERMKEINELKKKGFHISNPKEYCKKWWEVMSIMYVINPQDTAKVYENCCDFENEWPDNMMKHFTENIFPSIMQLNLPLEKIKKISQPVLTIHGRKDRNAPYGSGREWAFNLANARLLTIEKAAHCPWIDAPKMVLQSIDTFLKGKWPEKVEIVKKIDPKD